MRTIALIILSASIFSLSSCRFFGCNDVECAPCPSNNGITLFSFKTEGLNSFSQEELDSIKFIGPGTENHLTTSSTISSFDLNIEPPRGEEEGIDTGYVLVPNQDRLIIHSIKYKNVTPEGDGGCCGICAEYEFISVIINDSLYSERQLPLLVLNK